MTPMLKSQNIRLLDIFFIGPLLIYTGTRENIKPTDKIVLNSFGIATILYNAKNYQKYKTNQPIKKGLWPHPQKMRLIDVFIYGPFLIYAGKKYKLNPYHRMMLASVGVGSIVNNANNYIKYNKLTSKELS